MIKCDDFCEIVQDSICCHFCDKRSTCENSCTDEEDCEILNLKTSEVKKFNKQELALVTSVSNVFVQIKALEKQANEMKESLLKAMEKHNIVNFEDEKIKITYVAATAKNIFDSTKFKEEHEDVYKKYQKTSQVKASVRIKVK